MAGQILEAFCYQQAVAIVQAVVVAVGASPMTSLMFSCLRLLLAGSNLPCRDLSVTKDAYRLQQLTCKLPTVR